jgi:phosphopantothenate-cysteine ligase/phosphopantothenoylcysteine decarboxylase/phosphopantothenate--cysteine ligase
VRVLVTAGNTQTPIDKVRCITNIFSGRTGTSVALQAAVRGHDTVLLTSHPEVAEQMAAASSTPGIAYRVERYRTYDELANRMEIEIRSGNYDAVIHSAAVSDYALVGVYAPADSLTQNDRIGLNPNLVDVSAGKVKSTHSELWLRLAPTTKLIDQVRQPWGFAGVLVKFKLEVDVDEQELLAIAERSRLHSGADLMAANTLEGMKDWALLGPIAGRYERIVRNELPARVIAAVENVACSRSHLS